MRSKKVRHNVRRISHDSPAAATAKFFANLELKDVGLFGSFLFYVFIIVFMYVLGYLSLSRKMLVALIFASLITLIIRVFHFRERPDKIEYSGFLEKMYSASFPSMHAMRSVILFTLFFLEFQSMQIFVLFFVLLILVGVNRVFTKNHYEADVIFGIIIGLFLGYFVYLNF